jgi:hypothetical protein
MKSNDFSRVRKSFHMNWLSWKIFTFNDSGNRFICIACFETFSHLLIVWKTFLLLYEQNEVKWFHFYRLLWTLVTSIDSFEDIFTPLRTKMKSNDFSKVRKSFHMNWLSWKLFTFNDSGKLFIWIACFETFSHRLIVWKTFLLLYELNEVKWFLDSPSKYLQNNYLSLRIVHGLRQILT